ncbi:MAG: DNA repair protein [Clostridia bacterium]|nr:DNA repair protein [Clostridia bacterium]
MENKEKSGGERSGNAEDETPRYLCIDLKSFYASVECVERGLDPMKARLVVADPERGGGTICLAVSPAMKKLGVRNRCRVYEIPENISYIKAPPRMRLYMEYSARVCAVFGEFICADDTHVYSVDEAFLDTGPYFRYYGADAVTIGRMIVEGIKKRTGLVAACGVGSNLYLAKIALDITAKHSADFMGVLTREEYIKQLWRHRPLTDFWQIGPNTERSLQSMGLFTMRDVAVCDEDLLYRAFGVNAQLLIDHANGIEPVEIRHIKAYRSKSSSLSSGQILMRDYSFSEARVIVAEMLNGLCLQLFAAGKTCRNVSLTVSYSRSLALSPAHGTVKLGEAGNSSKRWMPEVMRLYENITSPDLPIRQINICCGGVAGDAGRQLSLFDSENDRRDLRVQGAVSAIKARFGKNSIFNAMDLKSEATALQRNLQIGGHRG